MSERFGGVTTVVDGRRRNDRHHEHSRRRFFGSLLAGVAFVLTLSLAASAAAEESKAEPLSTSPQPGMAADPTAPGATATDENSRTATSLAGPPSQTPMAAGLAKDRAWMTSAPAARINAIQVAVRLGGNSPYDDFFGPQFGGLAEAGYKQGANNFLGAYVGGGVGPVGRELSDRCPRTSHCAGQTVSFRAGAEFQRHFLPGERFNPWFGIGLGFAYAEAAVDRPKLKPARAVASGLDLRLMLAIDIRLTATFAMGPVVDVAYQPGSSGEFVDGDGGVRALPEGAGSWATVAWRFVLFP